MQKMNIKNENSSKSNNKYRFLKAVEITPTDDTSHGNIRLLDIEWWYFDAIFDNGYSIQIGFRTYHVKKLGIVQSRINIYKDGKTIKEKLKIDLFSNFNVDRIYPDIKINDVRVVKFDREAYKNGEWKYCINFCIADTSVDLSFIGKTTGWKIETSDTCWSVPLPKAIVEGKLEIQGQTINVNGVGYHDHNWSYSPTTAMNNFGWYWGRTSADKINITWAKVIHDKNNIDILAVVNKDDEGFFNIHPNNIDIMTDNYQSKNRGLIPHRFFLKINDEHTNDIKINSQIDMSFLDIQYTRIFTIKYWRYHVKANGFVEIGNYSEKISDKPQIIEYLKFKARNII